jgi:hypothetical protein
MIKLITYYKALKGNVNGKILIKYLKHVIMCHVGVSGIIPVYVKSY